MPAVLTAQEGDFQEQGKSAEIAEAFVPDALLDAALVARAQTGDLAAMETLFLRHEVAVFRLAFRILHCADDADDVRQETFVRVWASLGKFRGDSQFRTYTLAVCSNLCRDRLRESKRRPVMLYGLAPGETHVSANTDPQARMERSAENERVRRVIESLPPLHRETLHLRYVEDLSAEEIAAVTNCSRIAVSVRLFRARKAFEKAFRADGLT
ncbi:MAG: RNA polymerase sigma factor [Armatimonadetes bacterium]|nr:RNA polymerase sigma factor [Armatimonadota bacterium]